MATKYQIFISSTYQDLKAERDQVIRAVLEMGHIPVGMEMFSAADEEQWQIISRHIDESDYYAVIVAHRYGSSIDGVSYTRKEYEYAVSQGVPALGFIVDSAASWPADRIDKSEEKNLLDDFKAIVKQKPVSFWTSADDLYGKFSVALMKAITVNPREGWIRASAAAGPEVTAEMTRLSAENAKLRNALSDAQREADTDREAELRKCHAALKRNSHTFAFRYRAGDRSWQQSPEVSSETMFDLLAATLLAEASVTATAGYLALHFGDKDEDRSTDIVALNQVRELFADWNALDLVTPSDRKRSLKDKEEYWTLTPFGKDFHKWTRYRLLTSEGNEVSESKDSSRDAASSNDDAKATSPRKSASKKATARRRVVKKQS
jgi:hypothetical protein